MNAVEKTKILGANSATDAGTNNGPHRGTRRVARASGDQQRHTSSNVGPTKIKIGGYDNPRKTLIRDIITAFIPIFVLFKLSTHPALSNLGRPDPNAPKKGLELMAFLALKKEQEDLRKEYFFLEAMDASRCHDFPAVDMPANWKQRRRRRKRQTATSKGSGKKKHRGLLQKMKKRNKIKTKRPPPDSSPSAAPWTTRIASTFQSKTPIAASISKGTETANRNGHLENHQGEKKQSKRRPIKKKYGKYRRPRKY